jgi:hypothetical protein
MSEEEPRLEAASDGYQVRYRGKRLYAPGHPRRGAARRATATDIPKQTLVIAASPLLGYGLTELLAAVPEDCTVLAVELDPGLATLTAASQTSEAPRDGRLHWALAPPAAELEAVIGRLLRRRPRRVKTIALSGGFGLHAASYRSLAERLEGEIRIFWQNAMTRVRMGRLWIRNLLRNLPVVAEAAPLSALSEGRPILVVGAGPSVDEHLAEIPREDGPGRGRVIIMAVDTALAPLAAHGTTPDIVVAVESQQANAADFLLPVPAPGPGPTHRTAAPRDGRPVPRLVCDLTTYPAVARLVPGTGASFVSSRFAPTALLDRLAAAGLLPEPVPPLGSVGVLAVHLARRLTTGGVRFVGLDFTYDLERTHAAGSPMHTRALSRRHRTDPSPFFGLALSRPLLSLTDKAGAPVRSDAVLLSYAEQLRSIVAGATGIYDLAPEAGLPNGAPAAEGVTDARAAAEGERGETGGGFGPAGFAGAAGGDPPAPAARAAAGAPPAGAAASASATAFLRGERRRLSELGASLREAISRAGSAAAVAPGDYRALQPLLWDCDYVYLDFPDEPTDSRAFLGRALLSALDYEGRIDRVLRGIDRRGGG